VLFSSFFDFSLKTALLTVFSYENRPIMALLCLFKALLGLLRALKVGFWNPIKEPSGSPIGELGMLR